MYNVYARAVIDLRPRLVLSHHIPEVGLVTRITGLRASTEYEFTIQAIETGSGARRTSRPCRAVLTKAGPDAVLLVGALPLTPGELVLQQHLQGLGLMTRIMTRTEARVPIAHAELLRTWAAPTTSRLLVVAPSCLECSAGGSAASDATMTWGVLVLRPVASLVSLTGTASNTGPMATHGKQRVATLGMGEATLAHMTATDFARLTRATRWALGDRPRPHLPELNELFARQGRKQAATLFSLAPVHAIAGPSLRREYIVALRELACEAVLPGMAKSRCAAEKQGDNSRRAPCAHCSLWPARPLFRGFSAAVRAIPEVSDADMASVYREVIAQRLAPLRRDGGVRPEHLEAAARLPPVRWNVRYQIVGNRPYSVGPEPQPINHHHRKRLRGVRQLLHALVRPGSPPLPDVDFVLNLGDAPKLILAPSEAALARMQPPSECAALTGCADFEWTELAAAPHGPFGPIHGSERLLGATSALDSNGSSAQPPGPLMTATSCLFSHDLSFPTAWYDFDESDDEFARMRKAAAVQSPWQRKLPIAFFRGSIYWYERHGRTRAFARSLAAPTEIDVDWWEQISTASLETDGQGIFGNGSALARYRYLLSLEGHSYWSFRLRHLLQLGSAVLHQDTPCHEFWHALLRPYEHYVPVQRDLSDLRARLRELRSADEDAEQMAARATRLASKLLSRRAVLAYVRELFVQYATLLHNSDSDVEGPVRLHPLAEPLG